jgi:molybdate transport system substrate-binding protein
MAEKLTGISSMATRQILNELAKTYELKTGRSVSIISVGGVDAARRVREGETFDLVVLAEEAMAKLDSEGFLKPGTSIGFAKSSIAIAAPAGMAHPDLSDEQAVKAAIIAAPSVGYSTGPSGDHLMRLVKEWGIESDVSSRMVLARPGMSVGALLARGEAALGFQQLSELQGLPGIDVIGVLPASIQKSTIFTCGLSANGYNEALARDFIAFATSLEADDCITRNGMAPVRVR